jgi:hypothetical protein
MTSRLNPPARRAAALFTVVALLTCAASALAATPVSNGSYRGPLSDGGRVALRVVSGGARLHWSVAFKSHGCTPSKFTSRSGTTFDRTAGTPIHSDGSYREVVKASNATTLNSKSGYRDTIRAVFKGQFVTRHRANGRFEQRETFYRPNGSTLATCLRRLTYRAVIQ